MPHRVMATAWKLAKACTLSFLQHRQSSTAASGSLLERRIAEMKSQGKTAIDPPGSSRRSLPGIKHVLLVGAGKGGVGKSTLAANLSLALTAQGQRVGLLDADFHGPSIPRLLGLLDARAHLHPDSGHFIPVPNYGIQTMSLHYLRPSAQKETHGPSAHAVVWRGLMLQKMLHQFLFNTNWGELDYLVVDLPPGTGDTPLTICQSLQKDAIAGAVLISTPQAVALDDVAKAAQMMQLLQIPILGWVKNMTWTTCPHCHHEHSLFPDPLRRHDNGPQKTEEPTLDILKRLNCLAELPFSAALAASSESGSSLWTMPQTCSEKEGQDSALALRGIWLALAQKVMGQCDARTLVDAL